MSRFCEIFLLVAGATLPTKLGMSFVIPVWGLKLLRERWRLGDAIKTSVWPGQTSNDWYSSTTWKETPKMTKWSNAFAFQIPTLKIHQNPSDKYRIYKSVSNDMAFSFYFVNWYRHASSSPPGGRPPLEEATWLLTSSDNFQSRTLSECPPMQILAAQDVT